jgi:dCMP deaminase
MKWDDLFMNMVHLVAMKSRDPSTHVGAVIVGPDHEVISVGYNGFPRGVKYVKRVKEGRYITNKLIEERQERPIKYAFYEHGERNACYNAARRGIQTLGCTMYTSGVPCPDCGRAIIQTGIKSVIVDQRFADAIRNTGGLDWNKQAEYTKEMFNEANVSLRYWSGPLLGIGLFIAGKEIK